MNNIYKAIDSNDNMGNSREYQVIKAIAYGKSLAGYYIRTNNGSNNSGKWTYLGKDVKSAIATIRTM